MPSTSSIAADKGDTALAEVGSWDTVYTEAHLIVVEMAAVAETRVAMDIDSPLGTVAEHSPRKSDSPIVLVVPAAEAVAAGSADSDCHTMLDDSLVEADRSVAAFSLLTPFIS